MVVIGYHASHEQHSPGELLTLAQLAEAAGFESAMCSDHLAPWTRGQGHSGFAWTWLGAAMATTSIPFGVVNAPGQRYHPVIIAQAIATVEQMFPRRFWVAFGSGEALNEHVTGDAWPAKAERQQRLVESVALIRSLLAGERVSVDGAIRAHDARIWSLPVRTSPLLGAAVSPETAGWVAGWSEGLITVGATPERARAILGRYRAARGAGEARLQIYLSLGDSDDEALAAARAQWAHSTIPEELLPELDEPEEFEARIGASDEALREAVVIDSSTERMAERLARLAEGVDHIYLHHVGQDQRAFLRRCEAELLPALRDLL